MPETLSPALLLPLLAAAVVYFMAPGAVNACRKRGMLASHTEDRHIHAKPTPHGGGFILPLVVTPLGLVAVHTLKLPFEAFLTALLLAGTVVACVGWRDDRQHVEPVTRLSLHLFAVSVGLIFLPPLFDFMPLWAEKLLLMLAWGWFVNLYNFMDGADGLAATQAIFISLALAYLVPAFAPLTLLLAAASAGFLRVNLPPAKVFMGDVSSTWLGYVLGGLLLVSCAHDTWTYIWPLITITLVFSGDATATLVRRVAAGHKPWVPHRTFYFHRYLESGRSHAHLLVGLLSLNLVLFVLAAAFLALGHPFLGLVAGLVVISVAGYYIQATRQPRPPKRKGK